MTRFYALTATLAAFILLTACGGGGIAPLGVPLDGINDDRVTGLQRGGLEGESGGELLDTRTTFGDFCAQFPGYALCSMTHDEYLAQLYPQASPASTKRGGFFSLASSDDGPRGATTEVDYIDWSTASTTTLLTEIRNGNPSSATEFESGYLGALIPLGSTNRLSLGGITTTDGENLSALGFDRTLTLGWLDETRTITKDGIGFMRSRTTDYYAGVLSATSLAGPVVANADNSAIWTGALSISRGVGSVVTEHDHDSNPSTPPIFRRNASLNDVHTYNDLELLVTYGSTDADRTIKTSVNDELAPFRAFGVKTNRGAGSTPVGFSLQIDAGYNAGGVISGTTTLTQTNPSDANTPFSTAGTVSGLIGSTDGTHYGNRALAAIVSDSATNAAGGARSFVGGFVARPLLADTSAEDILYSDWVAAAAVPETPTLTDGAGLVRTYANNQPIDPVNSANYSRRWLNLAKFDESEKGVSAGTSTAQLIGIASTAPAGQASGVVMTAGMANPASAEEITASAEALAALQTISSAIATANNTIREISAFPSPNSSQMQRLREAQESLATNQGLLSAAQEAHQLAYAPIQAAVDSIYFTAGILHGTDLGGPATGPATTVTWEGRAGGFWGRNGHSFRQKQYINSPINLCINLTDREFASHPMGTDCTDATANPTASTVAEDADSIFVGKDTNGQRALLPHGPKIRFNGGWNADGVINSGDVRLSVPLNTRGDTVVIDGADTTLTGLVGELGAVGAFHGSTGTASSSLHFAGGFVAKPSE